MRIVSLLPSATDILVALGATDQVVGVSHSCGSEWSDVPRLTRTWIDTSVSSAEIDEQVRNASQPLYELNLELLEALAPDVIVSQSLCEVCAIPAGSVEEAIRALPNAPVLLDLSPQRLAEVPLDFTVVGDIIGRPEAARALQSAWHETFGQYRLKYASAKPRIAFLDWLEPPFAAGHWVPDLIEWLGGVSVLAQSGQPSYALSWAEIANARPDVVLAACCGFDETRIAREANDAPLDIVCLDGYQHFSRPSPVLMESIAVLDRTIGEWLSA